MPLTGTDFSIIAPVVTLMVTGLGVLLLGLFVARIGRYILAALALAGLALSAFFTLKLWNSFDTAFGGMLSGDNFALTFNCLFLIAAGLSLLLAFNQHEGKYLLYPEFLSVLFFATVGMLLMAATTNLLVLFLGLETLSISLYILAGIKRTEVRSLEAAFKYFLLGAFASAFLLYGMAFLYGATGTLDSAAIAQMLIADHGIFSQPLLVLGSLLVVVGLGFKVSMFPFHMWAPDVYQGAPTPVTAFMSTGSKAAGFAAMMRILFSTSNGTANDWVAILWVVAVLTMTIGNVAALVQSNVKRMLAYSSVAHAGYLLVGLVAWNDVGKASMIFYLFAYTFMTVGAFGVVAYLADKQKEHLELSDFKGLGYTRPFVAVVMAVFMFSLAGLPPTAGFVGKFYLFSAAVKAGHVPLAVFGVVNSMISLYYYLGVVVNMFMKKSDSTTTVSDPVPAVSLSLLIALLATLGLGLFPSYWIDMFEYVVGVMV